MTTSTRSWTAPGAGAGCTRTATPAAPSGATAERSGPSVRCRLHALGMDLHAGRLFVEQQRGEGVLIAEAVALRPFVDLLDSGRNGHRHAEIPAGANGEAHDLARQR